MKIKSLILSSVAAVGFSSGAMAADLGTVLTSLDVCDALGISGLTISSDTNCLSITGGVEYSFKWGDYDLEWNGIFNYAIDGGDGPALPWGSGDTDWDSQVDAWLKFVGTADSSFGSASATIKLGYDDDYSWVDGVGTPGDTNGHVLVDEAYVSIGETTILMAGQKGTIANLGDDEPLNWLGLFNSEHVGTGVGYSVAIDTGTHVIQGVSDLGNGFTIKGGLEDLGGAGTAVGVMEYSGNGVDAHATVLAGGILTGAVTDWALHTGFTAELDMFTIGGAAAFDDTGWWNVMGTASGTFDMFELAASVEATSADELGFGVSASADVTEGVKINAGFRWFDSDTTDVSGTEGYQAAVQVVADVTETITITGEIGVYDETFTPSSLVYGSAILAWSPGGGFDSSVAVSVNDWDAYSIEFKASKDFE